MRQVSQTYKTLKQQAGSYFDVRVLLGNKTYTTADLVSIEIHPKLFGETGPQVGKACSSECDISLIESSSNWPRMAEFEVQVRRTDGTTSSEWLSMGTYYTDERVMDEVSGVLSITAFDSMLSMERYWTDAVPEEYLPANWPITSKAWIDMLEDAGLIQVDSRSVIDDTVAIIGLNTPGTIRDVLKDIAAANGGNWVFTFDKKLRLIPFVNMNAGTAAIAGIAVAGIAIVGTSEWTPPENVDAESLGMNVERVESSPWLSAVTGVRLETDGGTTVTAGATNGYVLEGICNFSSTEGVAALCFNRTGGYVYKPFTATNALLDPAAEIGDIVIINGVSYQMMGIDWNISSMPTATLSAAYEEEVNHEYNYLDESAKNYRKSVSYTDSKAGELNEEIVAAKTEIFQTAEAVGMVAEAVGGEPVESSDNLIDYPYVENERTVTVNGLRFTYNYDGSVSIDGTSTATVYYPFTGETTLESGTYTFSVDTPTDFNPSTSYSYPLRIFIGSSEYNLNTVTTSETKKVYSRSGTASGKVGMILAVNSGVTIHATVYPQIVSGSSVKDWSQPVGSFAADRLNRMEASIKVTAGAVVIEAQRADAAEKALIADVDVQYNKNTSSTTAPAQDDPNWSTTAPTWESGKYIWQRTKTTTGGGSVTYSNPTCIQGAAATAYSLQISNAAVVNDNGTFSPSSITLSAKAQSGAASMTDYAGRFKIETTTDNSTWTSRYTSSSNESSKSYTIPTNITGLKAIRCSLYAAGGTTTLLDQEIVSVVSEGATGEDGYTVILSNSNHTFAGGTSAAVAGSTTCNVIAYKGATQMSATIGTISGKPTGMTTSITNNGTTSAYFTVTVTTSMATTNGVLTVPVTVDGKTFNMKFTYSLALKGADGESATGYSFRVSNAVVLTDESGYNPTAITLSAKEQAGETTMTDYSGRFKIETSYNNTDWKEQYVSSANESSKDFTIPTSDVTNNLMPYPLGSHSSNGMSITDNGDGSYTIAKQASTSNWYMQADCNLPAGTYTLTYIEEESSASNTNYPYLQYTAGGSSSGWKKMTTTTSGGKTYHKYTFTTTDVITKIIVNIDSSSSQAPSDWTAREYVVLNSGSSFLGWEPPAGADGHFSAIRCSLYAAGGTTTLLGQQIVAVVTGGEDGISPTEIIEQYYLSTSSSTQSGGSWSDTQPAWVSGKYIWTRSKITWSDSPTHITYTDPVLAQAINGANQTAYQADQDLNYTVVKSNNIVPHPLRSSSLTQNGVTLTFYGDGSINVAGTANSTTSITVSKSSWSRATGKYCFQVETSSSYPKSGSRAFSMGAVDSGGSTIPLTDSTTDNTQYNGNRIDYRVYDVTGGSTFYLIFWIVSGTTYNYTVYPQVVEGNEVLAWSAPVGATMRLGTAMKYAQSQIISTADGISMTVKKGNVISSINQSSEAITINANKLNLTGYITATDVGASGSTVINGSRISGGTLTLGGSNNGNGQINVKNASGTTIGKWTKDGISVDGGSITGTSISGGTIDGASIIGTTIEFRGSIYGSKLRMYSYSSTGSASIYRIDARYSGYGILDIYADAGNTGYAGFGVFADGGVYLVGDNYSITINSNGIDFSKDGYGSIGHWG